MKHFFSLKLEEMFKLFFGREVTCPDTIEDAGLSCNRLDTQVSGLDTGPPILYLSYLFILNIIRVQEWLNKAERIRCPVPLPEGSPAPTVAKMLDRVLSRMPSGKDEKSEPHILLILTGDNRGGEVEATSPCRKKRAASEDLEAEMPKLGKKGSPGVLSLTGTLTASCPRTGQPSNES